MDYSNESLDDIDCWKAFTRDLLRMFRKILTLNWYFEKSRQHCKRYQGRLETLAAEDGKHHIFCVYQLTMTLSTCEKEVIIWVSSYFCLRMGSTIP